MKSIELKAPAKINLSLDVTGKREDGYHLLETIMQTVGIYDRVALKELRDPKIEISSNLGFLPTDGKNICYGAASLLMGEFGIKRGIAITLGKKIPVAAGMAGGSADAAAVLKGINEMFALRLSKEALMERALKLGADVPYCICGGTVLASGIGEELKPVAPMFECAILVAKPGISVSTKRVYSKLKLDGNTAHPDTKAVIKAIGDKDLDGMKKGMGNVLESVTIKENPVIGKIKEIMMEQGAKASLMSGSGPSVFGLFADMDTARRAGRKLKALLPLKQLFVTAPV